MVLIAAGAVAAAAAWVIILLSPASDHPAPITSEGVPSNAGVTAAAVPARAVPTVAAVAGRSMVQLQAITSHGTVTLVGVAVAEGGLVATTADALTGLRSISMVGAQGSLQRASVMAMDHGSDLALVSVPANIPVPTFADDAALSVGALDMTLSLGPASAVAPVLRCQWGSVTAVGPAISQGPAGGMPAIVTSAPSAVGESGDPLLNQAGAVIGLLYRPGPGVGAGTTFLPTQLVLGVTDDLRSDDKVVHGWLGLDGADAEGMATTSAPTLSPHPVGAEVASVDAEGPAAGHLHAGEVIVGVNAQPVRTMAELRARLYVLSPGTQVTLSVLDGTMHQLVEVSLSASP
jgi:S1-C subfamily serine protease